MNPLVIEILKQVIIAVAGISIVGATVATGTIGASNLVSRFTQKDHKIAQVQADDSNSKTEGEEENSTDESNSKSDAGSIIPKSSTSPISSVKKVVHTGTVITPKHSTAQFAQNSTGCNITLSGQQYNVTSLQQSHSGGDIFNCGTDMTSAYQGKHGSNLSRMQRYLVSAVETGGTISGSSGSTGASGTIAILNGDDNDEDEHVDEKREEEMKKVLESAKKELEHEDD